MNICIIGGSGFIGGYLIEILKGRHYITIIDKVESVRHKEVSYVRCDIRDYDNLLEAIPANTDYVILLAAEHRDDVTPKSLYYDVNVKGTQNVLKVLDEKKIRNILFASSVSVYGLNKHKPDEFSPADPFNHYGKSKLEAEEQLRKWFKRQSDQRTLIILRPTVVFGAGNRGNVYNLLAQISTDKFLMVGNGTNKKSMAYVENVAGFIKHCIVSGYSGYRIFNYIDKPDLSTKQLVSIAEQAIGKKILPIRVPYWMGFSAATVLDVAFSLFRKSNPVSAVRVKKFCATTQYDSATIGSTGYQPPFSLEEGLMITIKSIITSEEVSFDNKHASVAEPEFYS